MLPKRKKGQVKLCWFHMIPILQFSLQGSWKLNSIDSMPLWACVMFPWLKIINLILEFWIYLSWARFWAKFQKIVALRRRLDVPSIFDDGYMVEFVSRPGCSGGDRDSVECQQEEGKLP